MLDQTFSMKNIRRIYDIEERKGNNPAERFFPNVFQKMSEISVCIKKIKSLRKKKSGLAKDAYLAAKNALHEKQKELKKQKEELLETNLEEVHETLAAGAHKFSLKKLTIAGKSAFSVDDSAATFFAVKQVQRNLNRLYKVKQSDRNEIICQLRDVLSDSMPKSLIKTDFKSFYESIPTSDLMRKIEKDQLLSMTSKKVIKKILYEYEKLTGSKYGLPRGVGLSAYLSELYVREFDSFVKSSPDLIYYSRYVDDIIAIYVPHPDKPSGEKYLSAIDKMAKNLGLQLHPTKTNEVKFEKGKQFAFEYLGYKFGVQDGRVTLDLSTNKMEKSKQRLKIAFDLYDKHAKINEKKARVLLAKRVRFLTGNARLHNAKRNAYIGIYFSNKFLNSSDGLDALDSYLDTKKANYVGQAVATMLAKHSFKNGFEKVVYHRFTARQLSQIVSVWQHAA
ncbi:antiviral reverse transcriptase Drt3a [Parasphingorhabdus sp.]|uniref:antiviral reverse transcriptase Drt3a n=1 Tax=Parasphingorhabdus sp. TaxID=2709688 RepID=UPI003BAE4A4F